MLESLHIRFRPHRDAVVDAFITHQFSSPWDARVSLPRFTHRTLLLGGRTSALVLYPFPTLLTLSRRLLCRTRSLSSLGPLCSTCC